MLIAWFESDWTVVTAILALVDVVLVPFMLMWILHIKKEPTSAVAWSLAVLLMPIIGPLLFLVLGVQTIHVPLARKLRHDRRYGPTRRRGDHADEHTLDPYWQPLAVLARRLDGYPCTGGNAIRFFHEGHSAFDAMEEAIHKAEKHIHIEFYIFRTDPSGERFIDALCERAKAGVEVRFLYDAVGAHSLRSWLIRRLQRVGGQVVPFLPVLNPLRKFRINLRNHRKLLLIDGKVGFSGGFNIGDEYLGKDPGFGYWRDTHFEIRGPAVSSLQRVFLEDWDFASGETLEPGDYAPRVAPAGNKVLQVVQSGPHQELKTIREVLFAAITKARRSIRIATPYFVPDAGLLDALGLAGRLGLDVRLLCPFKADKWIPLMAARYYWSGMLDAGVKVYRYTKGFMHAKMVLIDGEWGMVGTANFDNRSLHLNFEVATLIHSSDVVAELEKVFDHDLETAIRLDREVYARRSRASRMVENACRLLSPVL